MFSTHGNDIITSIITTIIIITNQPDACTRETTLGSLGQYLRTYKRIHISTLNQSFDPSRFDEWVVSNKPQHDCWDLGYESIYCQSTNAFFSTARKLKGLFSSSFPFCCLFRPKFFMLTLLFILNILWTPKTG